jgi:threonine/homoserine/homoserine lactone efflux protein
MAIPESLEAKAQAGRGELAMQGLVTAVANPKGWAFFVALLPPFLDATRPLAPQLLAMVAIILSLEFAALLAYATGGQTLRHLLGQADKVRLLNRLAGSLMVGVGVWLMLG